jgi:beta-1,4-N-acetylglucosaminyltransferase
LYSISILIGLSFLAGHVLIAPSVSIYVAIFGVVILSNADRIITKSKNKGKVVFISSAGGHLTQLMKLQPIFEKYESVLITEDISINRSIKTNAVIRFLPYGSRANKGYTSIFARICYQSFLYFIVEHPQVIVTTGTHTAVPLAFIAKAFSRKLIYIESFAKRTSPNLTGRILYPLADIMVVQWEPMLKVYKKSENWGWIY